MFCINCGKPIEDGKTLCDTCAVSQAAPNPTAEAPYEPPYQLPYENSQPVQQPEAPSFQLNNPVQQPVSPQKAPKAPKARKGFPIGLAVVLTAVVGVAAAAVFCWDTVSSFFVRTFASPEDYMSHVEEKAAEDTINSLSGAYGQFLNVLGGGEMEQNAVEGEIRIQLGEDLMDMMAMGMSYSGMDIDLSWLSDIQMSVYSQYDDDKMQNKVGIGLGGTNIATVDMIMDVGNGEMYMTIPELTNSYLYMNMEDSGVDMDDFAEYQEKMAEIAEMLPSEEKVNALMIKYWGIVLANVEDVEKSTETVEVDGLEQKLNVITCTITEENLYDILIAILEDIQNDEELLECVVAIYEYAYQGYGYWDYVYNEEYDYYEEVWVEEEVDHEELVLEGIEEALDSLENMLDDADDDNCIHLTTYIDNKDKIVGRNVEIELDEMDETVEAYYITVWEKNEFAFEANVQDVLEVEGSGSREKNLISGEYEITIDGEDLLVLEVKDYNEDTAEDGYINGIFTLSPGDALMEMITSEVSGSAVGSYLDFAKFAFEFELTSSENASAIAMNVKMGSALLFGVSVSGEYIDSDGVDTPRNYVDITDDSAVMEWVSGMDFDQLIENLEDAGVADEIVEYIAEYVAYAFDY